MIIQHLKYPFHHTIIYNVFDETELTQIHKEVATYSSGNFTPNDDAHHSKLFYASDTTAFSLDDMYDGRRQDSSILQCIQKVYEVANTGELLSKDNPFLRYISMSNQDNTFVQLYKRNSSYYEHKDYGVLTFLYPFKNNSSGGDLIFTNHEYAPHLTDNCCLIFPSFERHRVTPVEADKDGVARFSINQRIFIKN